MIKGYKEAVVTTSTSPTIPEKMTKVGTVAAGEDSIELVVLMQPHLLCRITSIGAGGYVICLVVSGDQLPFCFLVWLWLSPRFCRGKVSLSFTSFSFIYSSISPFLIFHIFLVRCPLFFNLPASGLRRSSYTERNSTHVVLCIWMIWRS